MKTLSRILFAIILIAGLASCKGDSKAAKAGDAAAKATATVASKKYQISPAESTITWSGSKLTGTHNGTIKLQGGSLAAEGSKITSGTFTIDMASLTNVDMAGSDGQAKLEGHLKNADFFDVEKFPTAMFNITSVAPLTGNEDANYTITGNLTLKGVEKSISFPAMVAAVTNGIAATTGSFAINRTDWGIKYGSESLADVVKDKAISDDILLTIQLMGSSAVQ